MDDRDTFAAAALTGMLGSGDLVIDPRNGTATTLTVLDAYRWADAMLRERSRAGQKVAESDSCRAACPERDKPSAETNNDRGSVTLTDAEREAVEQAEYTLRNVGNGPCDKAADTLRGLLERLS